jgi:vacuolar-type H+-ATPase subunit H
MLLAAHNIMDGSINITDLLTIGALIGGGIKLWYGQVQATKKLENELDALEVMINTLTTGHADKLTAMDKAIEKAENSAEAFYSDAKRRSTDIRTEFRLEDEKHHEIMNARVNKLQGEVKEDRKDNKGEFEKINVALNGVSTDTKAILMMLQNK